MKLSRRKKFLFRIILLSVGTVAGLMLAEVVLRVLGVCFFLPYEPDYHTGTRLRAGLSGQYRREGDAFVSINSHQQRDIERSIEKPKGTYRIAVLGDSYAEAMQVDRNEAFWAILESRLNEQSFRGAEQVEVLNFGVSGFGTGQELQMLREYVWQFEPDLVILAFLTGNDLIDNSPDIGPQQPRPYFQLVGEELILDDRFRKSSEFIHATRGSTKFKVACINASRLLQMINEVKTNLERPRQESGEFTELDELGLDWRVYLPPADEPWQEAWLVTEALLSVMHREVRDAGSEFLVVTLSNGIQVDPNAERRKAFQQEHEVQDLFYPDKRIESYCRKSGIEVLPLAPLLWQSARESGEYFHGFANTRMGTGHWNENGHRIAGELISDWLLTHE